MLGRCLLEEERRLRKIEADAIDKTVIKEIC